MFSTLTEESARARFKFLHQTLRCIKCALIHTEKTFCKASLEMRDF